MPAPSDPTAALDHPTLARLGWRDGFLRPSGRPVLRDTRPARVLNEHKRYFTIDDGEGPLLARISGKLRNAATARSALPVVGDFVLARVRRGDGGATIEEVLPRRTLLRRKAAGEDVEQPLCANVDLAFVVVALDAAPNPRRLERFLALCDAGGVSAHVLLTKADLCPDPTPHLAALAPALGPRAATAVSAASGVGMAAVAELLPAGLTAVLLGPSGAGKSTLVNHLLGEPRQAVGAVRDDDAKGRHTTTARCLIALPGGALLIDTPGIRELELWEQDAQAAETFEDVARLAGHCRFRDCRHLAEPDCAVIAAVARGALPEQRLEAYRKLDAEARARKVRLQARRRGRAG